MWVATAAFQPTPYSVDVAREPSIIKVPDPGGCAIIAPPTEVPM